MPGFAGLSCKSKAVVFAARCSSAVSRARLAVNVSAIQNSITTLEAQLSRRRRTLEGRPSSEGATSVLRLIDDLHTVAPDLGWNDLPTDMAENYKHHLYGHPEDGDR